MRLDTKKIYLTMAERGLTVTEIAKQGSVSQQAVSNASNGNRIGENERIGKKYAEKQNVSNGYFKRTGKAYEALENCFYCGFCDCYR